MKIAVAGGTGVAGRPTVEALRALGHEPVVIARSTGVDLVSGTGLADALVRVPGAAGRAMATGAALPDEPGQRGTQTFAAWLGEQQARGTL
jgi:nucleoside-diphosphate-sugar epimerase